MRICFIPRGDIKRASTRIRVYQTVDALRKMGHQCDIGKDAPFADMIVFQKRYSNDDINLAKRCKGKVIFDITDAEWHKDKDAEDGILHMAHVADSVVTSSTEQYMRLKEKGIESSIIQCGFDFDGIPRVSKEDKVTICFTGSSKNEKYLKVLVKPLNKLAEQFDFDLRLICDTQSNFFPKLNFKPQLVQWTLDNDLEEVARCHIGIAPVFMDDEWCRCKPSTKVIIYMALGLAVVASPITSYKEVIKHGENGFLAESEHDWYERLKKLIMSETKRALFMKEGKKKALEFSSDKIAQVWSDLFKSL